MDILGVSKIADSITNIVGRFIPDKNQLAEVKADLEKSISNGEIELEKIALKSKKVETDLKMEVIHNIPNFAIWYVLLFVIVFNFILPSTISYIARLFFYDAIINQGKDMTQIMMFLKPPTIELPREYWGMMGSIYGINKLKRGFNRHNDRKLKENLDRVGG